MLSSSLEDFCHSLKFIIAVKVVHSIIIAMSTYEYNFTGTYHHFGLSCRPHSLCCDLYVCTVYRSSFILVKFTVINSNKEISFIMKSVKEITILLAATILVVWPTTTTARAALSPLWPMNHVPVATQSKFCRCFQVLRLRHYSATGRGARTVELRKSIVGCRHACWRRRRRGSTAYLDATKVQGWPRGAKWSQIVHWITGRKRRAPTLRG